MPQDNSYVSFPVQLLNSMKLREKETYSMAYIINHAGEVPAKSLSVWLLLYFLFWGDDFYYILSTLIN